MTITLRQIEVLELANKGLTSSEIGKTLKISKRTVDYHFEEIYFRLKVNNRIQALNKAKEYGLILS